MADKYLITFNPENPPRGKRDNETFMEALARLRRILLHEIEIWAVSGVIIQFNGSVEQDGDLVNRLGAIPILKYPETELLSLNLKGEIDHSVNVFSEFITTVSGGSPNVKEGILITILPPKEKLSVNLYIKKGSVKSTDNQNFSPISTVTFRPVKYETIDYEFIIELVNGFTDDDFDAFLEQAYVKMEVGGGEVTDKARKSGFQKSKLGTYDIFQSDTRNKMQQDDKYVHNVVGDFS